MKNIDLQSVYNDIFSSEETFFTFDGEEERAAIYSAASWENKRVLEIGCGEGILSADIAVTGKAEDVLGIDYSLEAINTAKALFVAPNLRFMQLDILLEELSEKFDVIVMQGVLEHIDRPFEFISHIVEKYLEEDGQLITSSPSFNNLRGIIWMTLQTLFDIPMSLTDIHFFDIREMVDFLSTFGTVAVHPVYQSFGRGKPLIKDFSKRIRNALGDAGLYHEEKYETFMAWLKKMVMNSEDVFKDTNYTGVMTVYVLRKIQDFNKEQKKYDLLYTDHRYGGYKLESKRVKLFLNQVNDFNKTLVELFRDPEISTVLDVGCGSGDFGLAFKLVGPDKRLSGLDISSVALDMAQNVGVYDELILADLTTYSSKRKYDLVVFLDGLEHIQPEFEKAVFETLYLSTTKYLVLSISSKPAYHDKCTQAYGLGDVHVNLKSSDQWAETFKNYAEEFPFSFICVSTLGDVYDIILKKES